MSKALDQITEEERDIKFADIKPKLKGWPKDLVDVAYQAALYNLDISYLDQNKWNDVEKLVQYVNAKIEGYSLDNLDPDIWDDVQMYLQRSCLAEGLDLSNLNPVKWPVKYMYKQINALRNGFDLSNLHPNRWSLKQLDVVIKANVKGIDLRNLDPDFWTAEKMTECFKAKVKGIDISNLDASIWTADQMYFYWTAIKNKNEFATNLDITTITGRRAVQLIKAHNANADLSKINDIEKCDILPKYRSKTILDIYIESMSLYNLDISKLINTHDSYTVDDLSYIPTFCNMINISIDDYIKNEQYYIEITDKYDVIGLLRCFKDFLTEHDILLYNKEQINSIIRAYEDHSIDITDLDPKTWTYRQMNYHVSSLVRTGRGLEHLNRQIWTDEYMYEYFIALQQFKVDLLDIPNIEDRISRDTSNDRLFNKTVYDYINKIYK